MKKVTIASFAFAVAAFAASNTFHVTFDTNAWIGATEVKAGEYKVQVEGDKAVFKSGKKVIEVPAKLQTVDQKFKTDGIVISDKQKVQEIQIGGTNEKIVFANAD